MLIYLEFFTGMWMIFWALNYVAINVGSFLAFKFIPFFLGAGLLIHSWPEIQTLI